MFEDRVEYIREQLGKGYNNNIEIDLYIKTEKEYRLLSKAVSLQFDFDIEYRSWGIKDMGFRILSGSVDIDVEMDGEEKIVRVPLDNVKIDWLEGAAFIPVELSVSAEERDGEIVVSDVILEVYYLVP